MARTIASPRALRGEIAPPGDKSISHRAAMFNALANGDARVTNFSPGGDCSSTVSVLRQLGIAIERLSSSFGPGMGDDLIIHGRGDAGLQEPDNVLDVGNSGTTMRLMSGVLAGRPFLSVLTGDDSIRSRPMGRVVTPLTTMGARVSGRAGGKMAPLVLDGGSLRGIEYELPVASAQLKSCLMLAGLRAPGRTVISQPARSRDHTERMLSAMGAAVQEDGLQISVEPSELLAADVRVPADISSAAFWIVAALVHPDAEVTLRGVGVNPTRAGVLTVLQQMGADVSLINERDEAGEPVADIVARSSALRGADIGGDIIPLLLDEVPVIAVAAAVAEGETRIRDAAELRVKETDRISATATWVNGAGARCEETEDGMIIRGVTRLRGGAFDSQGDHRIAMALAVAGLASSSPITIHGDGAADISYPAFWRDLEALSGTIDG